MVAAVDPGQYAGGQVEVGQDRGGVAGVGELFEKGPLNRLADLGQAGALTAVVAAGGHGQGGGQTGGGVVAHRVEDGQVRDVTGDGVVVGVTGGGVGGFHHRGDGDPVVGEGARRHQRPLHLRRDGHGSAADQAGEGVAVGPFGHHQQAGQGRQVLHEGQQIRSPRNVVFSIHAQHTQAFGTVQHRHPVPHPPLDGGGHHPGVGERGAGHARLDRQLLTTLPGVDALPGHLPQHVLLQIGQEDPGVIQACGLGVLGHQSRYLLEGGQVTGPEKRPLHTGGRVVDHSRTPQRQGPPRPSARRLLTCRKRSAACRAADENGRPETAVPSRLRPRTDRRANSGRCRGGAATGRELSAAPRHAPLSWSLVGPAPPGPGGCVFSPRGHHRFQRRQRTVQAQSY